MFCHAPLGSPREARTTGPWDRAATRCPRRGPGAAVTILHRPAGLLSEFWGQVLNQGPTSASSSVVTQPRPSVHVGLL